MSKCKNIYPNFSNNYRFAGILEMSGERLVEEAELLLDLHEIGAILAHFFDRPENVELVVLLFDQRELHREHQHRSRAPDARTVHTLAQVNREAEGINKRRKKEISLLLCCCSEKFTTRQTPSRIQWSVQKPAMHHNGSAISCFALSLLEVANEVEHFALVLRCAVIGPILEHVMVDLAVLLLHRLHAHRTMHIPIHFIFPQRVQQRERHTDGTISPYST